MHFTTNRYDLFIHVTFLRISATLVARFILDLRTTYYSHHDSASNETVSSIGFAAHAGDLAAPLGPDSTWVTGQHDELGSGAGDLDEDLRSAEAAEQRVDESD